MKCQFISFFVFVIFVSNCKAAQTESFDVRTTISSRFAETTISSIVKNDESTSQEIGFHILLPKEAFISDFSMTIDGKKYDAVVEEKGKAEKAFKAAKELNKTAGLVSTEKESTKVFKTSVNIEAGTTVEFKLVYQQLLRRIRGKYRHQIILLGSQLTDLLTIQVDICEKELLKQVEVLPMLTSDGKNVTVKTRVEKRKNSAHVEYLQGQNNLVTNTLASSGGSFVVEYELQSTPEGGQVILNNGYFAYFYVPDVNIKPRRVVFTLDVSGSMSGRKISQLKEAMINIISKLTEQDRFTIVTFESSANVWQKTKILHPGNAENIKNAIAFIDNMIGRGGTNINDALKTSLEILNDDVGSEEVVDPLSNYIVFLTDGRPTTGTTIAADILRNVLGGNYKNFAVHAIGFGTQVDAFFLKSLAAQNQGSWTQIFEDFNSALQIQNYLDELSVTLLKDIVINYPEDIVEDFIVYDGKSVFPGGELMAWGSFKNKIDPRNRGPHIIEITGNVEGGVVHQAEFYLDEKPLKCDLELNKEDVSNFGKKSFALIEVVETLRQYDAATNDSIKEELKEKAINKSINAGLVTPVTSLLVIKPKDLKAVNEKVAENDLNQAQAPKDKKPIAPAKAKQPATPAPANKVPWWQVQGDPHFVIQLSDSITTCFNWMGKSGEIFNLLNDPGRDIVINGLVDGPEKKPGAPHAIYITKLVILLKREKLVITIDSRKVVIRDTSNFNKRKRDLQLPMTNVGAYETKYGHVTLRTSDVNVAHTILNVTVSEDISFIINLHHPVAAQSNDFDHLDLMIDGSEKLSSDIGGVFGRFPRQETEDKNLASIEKAGSKTYLWYKDDVTTVAKRSMMVPYMHKKVDCWFVAKPAVLLGSSLESFTVNSLTSVPKQKKL